jgi:hypothetical protein
MSNHYSDIFDTKLTKAFSEYPSQEGFYSQIFKSDLKQIDELNDLVERNSEIKTHLDKYSTLNTNLTNHNSVYNDFPANKKLDITREEAIQDAVQNDAQEMITQQNNTYIIGMIGITTLIVTTFLVLNN